MVWRQKPYRARRKTFSYFIKQHSPTYSRRGGGRNTRVPSSSVYIFFVISRSEWVLFFFYTIMHSAYLYYISTVLAQYIIIPFRTELYRRHTEYKLAFAIKQYIKLRLFFRLIVPVARWLAYSRTLIRTYFIAHSVYSHCGATNLLLFIDFPMLSSVLRRRI